MTGIEDRKSNAFPQEREREREHMGTHGDAPKPGALLHHVDSDNASGRSIQPYSTSWSPGEVATRLFKEGRVCRVLLQILLDIFCGIGTIGLCAAHCCEKVGGGSVGLGVRLGGRQRSSLMGETVFACKSQSPVQKNWAPWPPRPEILTFGSAGGTFCQVLKWSWAPRVFVRFGEVCDFGQVPPVEKMISKNPGMWHTDVGLWVMISRTMRLSLRCSSMLISQWHLKAAPVTLYIYIYTSTLQQVLPGDNRCPETTC